ncbi:phenylalanine--tRNA ligase beta subunit-related protein [Halocatena marina]|uniref:Phenylalanine--tRNA ligase beta subunit-related protein n=1 Tax=Halocatena marina TaxID=2934937 RepID=A0ABD5YLA8_9EURY|nr:B3/4 domain-containing protein [Halocatena marina]
MGYSDQTPDGEKRVKLIERRGLNRHNNVVDAYNIAGAEYGIGLGMHDVAQLDGNIVIERASGGEEMVPLFRESHREAREGDLIYGTDDHVLWLSGQIGRDADDFRVTTDTDKALLMAVGNEETSEEYNRSVCRRAFDLISKTCSNASIEFLDVEKPVVNA